MRKHKRRPAGPRSLSTNLSVQSNPEFEVLPDDRLSHDAAHLLTDARIANMTPTCICVHIFSLYRTIWGDKMALTKNWFYGAKYLASRENLPGLYNEVQHRPGCTTAEDG